MKLDEYLMNDINDPANMDNTYYLYESRSLGYSGINFATSYQEFLDHESDYHNDRNIVKALEQIPETYDIKYKKNISGNSKAFVVLNNYNNNPNKWFADPFMNEDEFLKYYDELKKNYIVSVSEPKKVDNIDWRHLQKSIRNQ